MTVSAEVLADYVTELRFEDIPANVVRHTKFVLLDAIGCALGGAKLGKAWNDAALYLARDQGGAAQATIWHYGDRVPSLGAVFANGVFAHSMDFSDDLAGIQIGGIVPTTAFAIGESIGVLGPRCDHRDRHRLRHCRAGSRKAWTPRVSTSAGCSRRPWSSKEHALRGRGDARESSLV